MQTVFQAAGGPSRVDRGQDNQQKAVDDILKRKLRPLNPCATDMAQELDAFFEHINEYFQAAKLTDLASTRQHTRGVSILNGTLGEEAKHALKSIRDTDKTTHEQYQAAIRRCFLTEYDPVHVMAMLVQCTMTTEESRKEYVTRLWAHVARLEDLSEVWHERLIMLRLGHSRPEVRDLLTKKQPKTIVHAERICEEYKARQRLNPVMSQFVAVMALTDNAPKAAVDNLAVPGGYRVPKARGRGQTRGGGQQPANYGSNQPRQQSALTCFRCGK
jgi:hypothetical protein